MATEFEIVIKINSAGAVRSAKAVEVQLKKTEAQGKKTQNVLKKAFAGVAVGQGAVQSIRFLASFSQEMSTVKAITKATEGQFSELREEAINLGTTTRFTSKQAASGMLFLARSGFKTKEILETIPGVLNLAQAGALDLGRAADITTNILKGFGLATSETARVVDVLALAANSANTTVEQMGQAMKFVAPIASGVNMSLEDTAAAIQTLSNAGLQASMAGTGLRMSIAALEGPTTAQEKILNKLGLTVDDVKVSSVGFGAALGAIRSKTNDAGIFLNLFGKRGGPAALVMAKMASEMTAFGIANKFAAGEAARVAKVMDDNLNGALLRVKSAFQGFLIRLGDVEGVSILRTALEKTADTFIFLANNAEGFNDVLKVVTPSILFFTLSTDKASASMAKFRVAMAANPLGVLILLLTTVVAALVLFKDELEIGGDGLITFGDLFRVTADFIRDAWNGLFGGMLRDFAPFQGGWQNLMSNMSNMFLAMALTVAQGFDRIIGFFRGLVSAGKLIGMALSQSFHEAWVNIANTAIDIVGGAFNFIISGWNNVAAALGRPLIPEVNLEGLKREHLAQEGIVTGDAIGKAFNKGMQEAIENGNEAVILGLITEAERRVLDSMRRLGKPEEVVTKTPDPLPIFGPDIGGSGSGKLKDKFGIFAAEISAETELLKLNSREMEIQARLIEINDNVRGGLNDTTERVAARMLKELQLRQEMAQAYDEIRGPMEDITARQEALNVLYNEGTISITKYNEAVLALKISQAELNNDMGSGLNAGLLRVKQNMLDLATTSESIIGKTFGGMSEAISNFVTGAETDFSGLVDSILKDLTKLLIQKALFGLLTGGAPIPGVGGGLDFLNFAKGGQFKVGGSGGTDSQQVAFNASPNERVTVETPAQQKANDAGSAAPPVINVVNVSDPNEIADAMNSREGEQVILNVITRNRNTVRNGLA